MSWSDRWGPNHPGMRFILRKDPRWKDKFDREGLERFVKAVSTKESLLVWETFQYWADRGDLLDVVDGPNTEYFYVVKCDKWNSRSSDPLMQSGMNHILLRRIDYAESVVREVMAS